MENYLKFDKTKISCELSIPQKKSILYGTIEGNLIYHFFKEHKISIKYNIHDLKITVLYFNDKNDSLVTGGADFVIKIWSFHKMSLIRVVTSHLAPLSDIYSILPLKSSVDSSGYICKWNTSKHPNQLSDTINLKRYFPDGKLKHFKFVNRNIIIFIQKKYKNSNLIYFNIKKMNFSKIDLAKQISKLMDFETESILKKLNVNSLKIISKDRILLEINNTSIGLCLFQNKIDKLRILHRKSKRKIMKWDFVHNKKEWIFIFSESLYLRIYNFNQMQLSIESICRIKSNFFFIKPNMTSVFYINYKKNMIFSKHLENETDGFSSRKSLKKLKNKRKNISPVNNEIKNKQLSKKNQISFVSSNRSIMTPTKMVKNKNFNEKKIVFANENKIEEQRGHSTKLNQFKNNITKHKYFEKINNHTRNESSKRDSNFFAKKDSFQNVQEISDKESSQEVSNNVSSRIEQEIRQRHSQMFNKNKSRNCHEQKSVQIIKSIKKSNKKQKKFELKNDSEKNKKNEQTILCQIKDVLEILKNNLENNKEKDKKSKEIIELSKSVSILSDIKSYKPKKKNKILNQKNRKDLNKNKPRIDLFNIKPLKISNDSMLKRKMVSHYNNLIEDFKIDFLYQKKQNEKKLRKLIEAYNDKIQKFILSKNSKSLIDKNANFEKLRNSISSISFSNLKNSKITFSNEKIKSPDIKSEKSEKNKIFSFDKLDFLKKKFSNQINIYHSEKKNRLKRIKSQMLSMKKQKNE